MGRRMTRRRFLGEAAACAGVGRMAFLSTALSLKLASRVAAAGARATHDDRRKSLVCILLSGGVDSYNLLVPYDTAGHAEYAAARSELAVPRANLVPLNALNHPGRFGLHPALVNIANIFNGGAGTAGRDLSFVANIGTLIEPITSKEQVSDKTVALPRSLFSHRDQVEQWQTSVPQGLIPLSGFLGRAADILHSQYNAEQSGDFMPMGISLSGNNTAQSSRTSVPFSITTRGSIPLTGTGETSGLLARKAAAERALFGSRAEERYANVFARTYADITGGEIERAEFFSQVFNDPLTLNGKDVDTVIAAAGFTTGVGSNLPAVVKTLALRELLKLRRQTLFLQYGGWDHHAGLVAGLEAKLPSLDANIWAYYKALNELGLLSDVVTFTISDFGRTLRSNGSGSDHAWSGNQFVFGGDVAGGNVLGQFPQLVLGGPDDVRTNGRLFPRTSVDSYYCELLRWFGVAPGDMESILPNIRNFLDPYSTDPPVGFMV
jgi:uncharacterized protein (DUF1501 family)